MKALWTIMAVVLIGAIALRLWRSVDELALTTIGQTLIAYADPDPNAFEPESLSGLPEPVQRFFNAVIKPQTPLYTAAEIVMHGELSLGGKNNPAYRSMEACELLVPPYGFYWQVRSGVGLSQFSGSDAAFPGGSWTRFWLLDMLPVARIRDNQDHALSSFGRYMSEAVFWTPAALLPSDSVVWEATNDDNVRVTVTHDAMSQIIDLSLNAAGLPKQVSLQRWSDANEQKHYRSQPFGGHLSDYREFDGYWLPTTVVAGNHFGTDSFFPFFKATIESVNFVKTHDYTPKCTLP